MSSSDDALHAISAQDHSLRSQIQSNENKLKDLERRQDDANNKYKEDSLEGNRLDVLSKRVTFGLNHTRNRVSSLIMAVKREKASGSSEGGGEVEGRKVVEIGGAEARWCRWKNGVRSKHGCYEMVSFEASIRVPTRGVSWFRFSSLLFSLSLV